MKTKRLISLIMVFVIAFGCAPAAFATDFNEGIGIRSVTMEGADIYYKKETRDFRIDVGYYKVEANAKYDQSIRFINKETGSKLIIEREDARTTNLMKYDNIPHEEWIVSASLDEGTYIVQLHYEGSWFTSAEYTQELVVEYKEKPSEVVRAVELTDAGTYYARETREYTVVALNGAEKLQFRNKATGGTKTFSRANAKIDYLGDGTEHWSVSASMAEGAYEAAAKLDGIWENNVKDFEIRYVTASSDTLIFAADVVYNKLETRFTAVTALPVEKIQLVDLNGSTVTRTADQASVTDGSGRRQWTVTVKSKEAWNSAELRVKYRGRWFYGKTVGRQLNVEELDPLTNYTFKLVNTGDNSHIVNQFALSVITSPRVEKIQIAYKTETGTKTFSAATHSYVAADGWRYWDDLKVFNTTSDYRSDIYFLFRVDGQWSELDVGFLWTDDVNDAKVRSFEFTVEGKKITAAASFYRQRSQDAPVRVKGFETVQDQTYDPLTDSFYYRMANFDPAPRAEFNFQDFYVNTQGWINYYVCIYTGKWHHWHLAN